MSITIIHNADGTWSYTLGSPVAVGRFIDLNDCCIHAKAAAFNAAVSSGLVDVTYNSRR